MKSAVFGSLISGESGEKVPEKPENGTIQRHKRNESGGLQNAGRFG